MSKLVSKFVSRKLFFAVATVIAAVQAKQYDAAFGVAAAYILAQAHVDAATARNVAKVVENAAVDVQASAGDPRFQ